MRPHLATLVENFRSHQNGTAIVTYRGNRRIAATYIELATLVDRFSAELRRREIKIGDRVVLWGLNSAEWAGAFFGCVLRGVIAVPLDAAGSVDFALRVIVETKPRLVVGDSNLLGQLPQQTAMLSFEDFATTLPHPGAPETPEASLGLDSPLQILFTSGTTSEPKGVVHTHRNIAASVAPIEREIQKYLRYERWVHPLRFLHTLPLSHVFGQFMGLWIPPLLGAEVHYESRLQAVRLIDTMRRERISVLAAVPRVLDLLREALLADDPHLEKGIVAAQGERAWKHWWRFRKIHHRVGYKFWAFVCGGASLPPDLENFWNTLGFALIQGYGMTETAALITLNHPFKVGKGSIGKVLPGRDVEIGEDGEIRVRGDMVSTTMWRNGAIQQSDSPWLSTGDLARRDESGQLHFLGRKNQVIVTSSGLNLHPEDVEAVLNQQPGIDASAVVPLTTARGPEPVAVLLFRGAQADAERAIIAANQQLADFQKVRRWKIWPELDLPRTSTGKIQRRKVAEWINAQSGNDQQADASADALLSLIISITRENPARRDDGARLEEDLLLDSLGRVQLQSALEEKFGLALTDEALEKASTLGDIRRMLGLEPTASRSNVIAEQIHRSPREVSAATEISAERRDIYPHWTWSLPVQWARVAFIEAVLRPLVWVLANPEVRRNQAANSEQSLLLIANHVSTYDLPLILYSLPAHMRRRVAAAMAANMLEDWRERRKQGSWLLDALGPFTYLVVTGVFNVFPLPRNAGFRQSFQHAGEALDRGYNVLVFPEGHRSADGTLQKFRSGIGLLVEQSRTPVLPIALAGMGEMKTGRQRWFRSGKLRVVIGEPMSFPAATPAEVITAHLREEIVRLLKQ